MAKLSVADLAITETEGKVHRHTWRKVPTQTTATGFWFDLSLSPGIPKPQYYIGSELTATQLTRSNNGSINHGQDVYPYTKHLRQVSVMASVATPLPMRMTLEDNLLFYPLVDQSLDAEVQTMINSSSLPRYTDGLGVMIKAVVTNPHATGGTGFTFTCSYTNQDGVSGRTTGATSLSTQFVAGTIISSSPAQLNAAGPYLPLQSGDYGVRSIESVTMSGSEVGLMALVLCKPIASAELQTINAPFFIDHMIDETDAPIIYDDACLNWTVLPQGTVAANSFFGTIKTAWL
jgi:hypothetical protein